jgi:hypothetical protein
MTPIKDTWPKVFTLNPQPPKDWTTDQILAYTPEARVVRCWTDDGAAGLMWMLVFNSFNEIEAYQKRMGIAGNLCWDKRPDVGDAG